ncbi:expressed unknown protein [Seminavis robusta]|uniref:Uncharacterized protein n=1 Tax=Seminavis robusta TaxID=568900 RepID=A0A9N8HCA8_9STRA|nr:expressed unknown protein [Seminavis robusta]|eukprot:Sro213_g088270.1 n/a (333) ;mRNA; f:3737-4735
MPPHHHDDDDDDKPNSLSANARWLRAYLYHGFRDCFRIHRKEHTHLKPFDYLGYVQLFLAKFLLEVCGAGGAIWGSSEILGFHSASGSSAAAKEAWRIVSLIVCGIFLVRFWWHAKHYLEHDREFPPIKFKHRRLHKLPFVQIFSAKMVLEVLGAAGAIWGPSDALTLRTADNRRLWQVASGLVGIVFWMRWIWHIMAYCLCCRTRRRGDVDEDAHLHWSLFSIVGWIVEVVLVRFVLVVCGAIGAVWGFAEIVTLRTPENSDQWRPICWGVGVIFLIRWILQTFAYATGGWEEEMPPPDESSRDLKAVMDEEDPELADTPVQTLSEEDQEK